jgi:hypothetical protein
MMSNAIWAWITAGNRMTIGVKYEMCVHAKGGARPPNAGGFGYAEIKEDVSPSAPGFLNGAASLNRAQGGIPVPGKRYVTEENISIFETDVPARHMWCAASGRYRFLWTETLKTVT